MEKHRQQIEATGGTPAAERGDWRNTGSGERQMVKHRQQREATGETPAPLLTALCPCTARLSREFLSGTTVRRTTWVAPQQCLLLQRLELAGGFASAKRACMEGLLTPVEACDCLWADPGPLHVNPRLGGVLANCMRT